MASDNLSVPVHLVSMGRRLHSFTGLKRKQGRLLVCALLALLHLGVALRENDACLGTATFFETRLQTVKTGTGE